MSFVPTLTVKRGDTWLLTYVFADENGKPVDLTGIIPRMQLRSMAQELLADYSDDLVVEGSEVSLEVIADLPVGTCCFDIELVFPDGTVLSSETIFLKVFRDITQKRPTESS